MRKRLFIAIPLPAHVRAALQDNLRDVRECVPRARFLASDAWHFTVLFLGHHGIEWVPSILGAIEATVARMPAPRVVVERMAYGPEVRPRMIWAWGDGKTSFALGEVRGMLEAQLAARGFRFRREHRPYTAHITLARFPRDARAALPPFERWSTHAYRAEGISLMESRLRRSGAAYIELASFAFTNHGEIQ